jgi:hypothetical protein
MNFLRKHCLLLSSILMTGILGFFLHNKLSEYGYYSYPSEKVSEMLGRASVYSLVIFFASNTLRKRWGRKKLEFWMLCLFLSFSLCTAYTLIKGDKEPYQFNNFKQEISRLVSDSSSVGVAQGSTSEYSVEDYGDLAGMLPIMKEALEYSEKMTAEINAACADLEDIFNRKDLCQYENIIRARVCVASFMDKLNECEKKYAEDVVYVESRIKDVFSEKENLKRAALRGFARGKKTGNELTAEYFNIERAVAKKIDNMLSFLAKKSGSFTRQDGQFIFKSDRDADTYNVLVEDFIEYSKKEELVLERLARHKQSIFKKWSSQEDFE